MAAGLLAERADAGAADSGVGHVDVCLLGFVGVVWDVLERGIVRLASEKVAFKLSGGMVISPLASLYQISGQPIGAFRRRCWITCISSLRTSGIDHRGFYNDPWI